MDNLDAIKMAATETGVHEFIRSSGSLYKTTLEQGLGPPSNYASNPVPPPNPYEDQEVPFTVKVLCGDPYRQAKARGKTLLWGEPPPKAEINIDIPKHDPMPIPEFIESRALSGGQWQRIALARAFTKIRETDLLILDEPSSALDPQAEYEVFKKLMDLRKNKTTIYIVRIYIIASDILLTFSLTGFIQFVRRAKILVLRFMTTLTVAFG